MKQSINAIESINPMVSISCLVLCFAFTVGCQNGPMSGRMQQYQLENERLLSEFRAQKKENEQLRADRTRLLQQQAETEKLAAKLQSQLSGGKSLTAQNLNGRNDFGSGSSKFPHERSTSNSLRSSERLSSSGNLQKSDPGSLGPRSASNADGLQWRPIRKETR